jgi:hypothetical protein
MLFLVANKKREQASQASELVGSSDNNWLRGHGRNPQCRISGGCRRGHATAALYADERTLYHLRKVLNFLFTAKRMQILPLSNEEFQLSNELSLHQSNGR